MGFVKILLLEDENLELLINIHEVSVFCMVSQHILSVFYTN